MTILGDHLETTNIGSPLFANQLSLMDRWMCFFGGQMFGSSLSHTPHDTSVLQDTCGAFVDTNKFFEVAFKVFIFQFLARENNGL